MRDGTCPKCGSDTVRQLTGGIQISPGGAVRIKRGGLMSQPSSYESFLCTGCGYFENYVTDVEKLQQVAAGDGGWAPP
jgi:predicted nucleic-acid-binding Zn-ribbon protein